MYVPNYIPGPLEVPGNVAQDPWGERTRFLRRTLRWHAATVCASATLGTLLLFQGIGGNWLYPALALALYLLLADAWRVWRRGEEIEGRGARWFLLAIVPLVAWLGAALAARGLPLWAPVAGALTLVAYAHAAGRDFSFPGAFLFSLAGSSVWIAAFGTSLYLAPPLTALALGLNAASLFYWTYDLASLMARRRRHETAAAAVDLFRDVFNFFGYIPRVIRHWRRHKIWDVVREDVTRGFGLR